MTGSEMLSDAASVAGVRALLTVAREQGATHRNVRHPSRVASRIWQVADLTIALRHQKRTSLAVVHTNSDQVRVDLPVTSAQQVADLLAAVGLVPVELTSGYLAARAALDEEQGSHAMTASSFEIFAEQWAEDRAGFKIAIAAGEAERDRLRAELARAKSLGGRIRWCGWPGCHNFYPAADGPTEQGWTRARSLDLLRCPNHSAAGHQVTWQPYGDEGQRLTDIPITCECGESEVVKDATLGDLTAWWERHVAAVAAAPGVTVNGRTAAQVLGGAQ
jgi:hypothetical protein